MLHPQQTNTAPNAPPPPPDAASVAESIAKYDAAYANQKDYIGEPNRFLALCLKRIAMTDPAASRPPRRRALDVGIGEGRNAILLARAGYETLGIERSAMGVKLVCERAARLGLAIRAQVADADAYDFGREEWDLVTLLYFPRAAAIIERLKTAVKPRGHIVIERFSQAKETTPEPDKSEGLLTNPLLRFFLEWRVLHYEHDVFESDWHWNGESPRGPIVRLLARRP